MGQKDITEKLLEDYNDVFADIVNVLVFGGKQRIKEEDLFESRVRSQYKVGKKLHEEERDAAKYWRKNGVEIALCGLENQTNSEKYRSTCRFESSDTTAQHIASSYWMRAEKR